MIRQALTPAAMGIAALLALALWHHPARRPAPSAPPRAVAPPEAVAGAIRRARTVLQADGDAWMEGRTRFQSGDGCVSCHQVPYGVWGLAAASRAGIAGDAAAAADLTHRAIAFVDDTRSGRPMSWSPLMLALGEEDPAAAPFVDFLLATQSGPGFWEAKGQFPSQRREISETNAVATMLAMLALDAAAGEDPAVAASLDQAEVWLAERGPGESTEWLALRALVTQTRGTEEDSRRLFDRLARQQNGDGGWGWNPGEPSNAFSTGETLWALGGAEPGTAPAGGADAASRGLAYLVASQADDGWWRVPARLTSRHPVEGTDYVYDYWGSAWATIGLARWHER